MSAIGERVRTARTGRGMSQTELARLMSKQHPAWMQSTVWKIETDQQHLKAIEVPALSAILLKSIGWLISGDESPDEGYVRGYADGQQHLWDMIEQVRKEQVPA